MVASIIWFFVILAVIILSHEFGHFIVARANGIRVIEFAMGFGPTLCSFTRKGTKFSLKLLPLGGACIFDDAELENLSEEKKTDEGEEAFSEDISADGDKNLKKEKPKGIPFRQAGVWARISTVFAGPFFNFIVAFIFAMIIVGSVGTDLPVVQGLTDGRPAAESGLKVNDVITKINGESIHVWRDISLISILNSGEELTIEYERDGETGTVTFTPAYSSEDNRYYIGIEGGTYYMECKGFDLIKYSWYELIYNFRNTLKSLKQLVLGKLSYDNLSGPVGIAQVVNENYDVAKDYGISSVVLTMMNIAMLLSVNLGVINLLPLPALDGGRLVFLLVEAVRGKPVPAEKEGMVHLIGIILFFLLAIFVFYNDIMRIIG